MLQQNKPAETCFRRALRLDPHLLSSRIGLAKIYQQEGRYAEALAELDAAKKLDDKSNNVHYLRGQVLLRMGRRKEGQAELATATELLNASRAKRQKELEPVPNPELTREPQ